VLRFEGRNQPLLSRGRFLLRLARSLRAAAAIVAVALLVGVLGYRFVAGLAWVDAIHQSAMILTGMGPVNPMTSDGAKLFSSGYALLSAVVFVLSASIVTAPLIHRLLHRFHLQTDRDVDEEHADAPPSASAPPR
jgi:hypothetical protein